MEDNKSKGTRNFITSMVVVVVLVLLTSGVIAFKKHSESKKVAADAPVPASQPAETTIESSQSATAQPATESAQTTATSPYKDGTYTATGSYSTPGGAAEIGITLTLKDGVVTGTTAQEMADNVESSEYQESFISGYKSQVVGKSIASLKLSKVSRSSLTPKGFNNAVEQIKSQAKA